MTRESPARVADVAFAGVDQLFSYRIPEALADRAQRGMRVLASFGHRKQTGIIVETRGGDDERATKAIDFLLDDQPAITAELLDFTRWVADYYLCPWGDALKAALPAGIALDEKRHWVLSAGRNDPKLAEISDARPELQLLFDKLGQNPLSPASVEKQFKLVRTSVVMRRLVEEGILAYRPVLRVPRVKVRTDAIVSLSSAVREQFNPDYLLHLRSVHEQQLLKELFSAGADGISKSDLLKGAASGRRVAFHRLLKAGSLELRAEEVSRWDPQHEHVPETTEPVSLTDAQRSAVHTIGQALDQRIFSPFLLYGVTGSGKTQVYIEAIRHVLAQGRTALVLLPEIALTPFVWGRFFRAFGDRVAIQHSAQSPAVRYDLWRDIRAGRYPVVVGARSAVFAPLENLGLVVVDEEQEPSFKQEDPSPRYHARDAALVRARLNGAVAILGSATPSVETMHNALSGRYQTLRLPERVGGALMPEIRIVQRIPPPEVQSHIEDAGNKAHEQKARFTELPVFTDELLEGIGKTLERGKQIILLQNRRGFAPFLICAECGMIPECPNCSISLTYHRRGVGLRCHYCDHREPVPSACPRCSCPEWLTQGVGTQRLEEELAERFPSARILRMDSDTVARQGMHGRMVTAFAAGEYDILVGTQMVAKGLDFPNVALSAVVQADAEFFFPDFRSSERAAALITQVAGRAGRRSETGQVIVQSAVLEHPVIDCVKRGDWQAFIEAEIVSRARSGFPPLARLILLRATAKEESAAVRAVTRIRKLLQEKKGVNILGPAPAVIRRMKGMYRFHILARSMRDRDTAGNALRNAVRYALDAYKASKPESGVTIDCDVDPQTVT